MRDYFNLCTGNLTDGPCVLFNSHRDHATELHNFLSRSDYFDARVVAHAVDPLNLTESDPKGDLRGWSSGKPIAAHPSVRGFASHLVLLRQKLGDHAAAIRLILDVVHGELIFISFRMGN